MTVYICEDSLEGILTGVYDGWMSRKGHSQVRLEIDGYIEKELFTEYLFVPTSAEKAEKVAEAVRGKISETAYEKIYVASLSREQGKADAIYRFLIYGFHYGKKVTDMLAVPAVFELFRLCRSVYNESHQWQEFIRFSETKQGMLISRIGPKNEVLTLLAPYFADRMPDEIWMIADERRKQAVLYVPGKGWALWKMDSEMEKAVKNADTDGRCYEELWKIFHSTIAIKERTNFLCQRTHLPMRYRPYMTEFQETESERR